MWSAERRRTLRIALDATGSELAPVSEIRGAIEAASGGLEVLLVGDAETLEVEVLRFGGHRRLSVLDACPSRSSRPFSHETALAASLDLLESRRADAVVSACRLGRVEKTANRGRVTNVSSTRSHGRNQPSFDVEVPYVSPTRRELPGGSFDAQGWPLCAASSSRIASVLESLRENAKSIPRSSALLRHPGRGWLGSWLDALARRTTSAARRAPERLVLLPRGIVVFAEPAGGALAIASAIATARAFLTGTLRTAAVAYSTGR